MKNNLRILLTVLVAALIVPAPYAAAQQERLIKPTQKLAPAAEEKQENMSSDDLEGEIDNTPQYYEQPTVQKFSQLYWAISALDHTNDTYIDNFLLINECDIYREYAHNEFEWKEIREAGRDFVRTNKKTFPLRFTFIQPIFLKDYNFERGGFEVNDEYKILGTRRFELRADDMYEYICGEEGNIEGYPRVMYLELSRPFNLEFVKVPEELAYQYIADKSAEYQALPLYQQTPEKMYETRDAYIIMNVKIYAYKGPERTSNAEDVAVVLGVLESFEVFADRRKETLMYSENFRRRKRVSKMEQDLIDNYKAVKDGSANKPPIDLPTEGMLLGD